MNTKFIDAIVILVLIGIISSNYYSTDNSSQSEKVLAISRTTKMYTTGWPAIIEEMQTLRDKLRKMLNPSQPLYK